MRLAGASEESDAGCQRSLCGEVVGPLQHRRQRGPAQNLEFAVVVRHLEQVVGGLELAAHSAIVSAWGCVLVFTRTASMVAIMSPSAALTSNETPCPAHPEG